jgi:hypothetical protein
VNLRTILWRRNVIIFMDQRVSMEFPHQRRPSGADPKERKSISLEDTDNV